jgi:hypothetical protein
MGMEGCEGANNGAPDWSEAGSCRPVGLLLAAGITASGGALDNPD